MPPKWLILLTTAAVTLPGCGTKYTVRSAASADYGCPEAQVEVDEISDGRYRVDACGHLAIYTCAKPNSPGTKSPEGQKEQSPKERCEEVLEEDGEMVVAADEGQETESDEESDKGEDDEGERRRALALVLRF